MMPYDPPPPQLMLPAPLPPGMVNAPVGSFMQQAQSMATPGQVAQGQVPYAQPVNQGAFAKLAYQLAGPAPQPPPHSAPGAGLPMTDPSGILTGSSGSSSGAKPNNKFSGAASGALMGNQVGGWPGAIVGGAIGYAANGGIPDADPTDMARTSIADAWQQQDLARLAGSPAASVASKLGAGDGVVSALDKLDPLATIGHAFSGGQSHKRNWDAFNQAFPGTTVNDQGNYVLPDGTTVNQGQLDNLAGTYYGAKFAPDGNQADWQQKWQQALTDTGAQPMFFGG